MVKRLYNRVFPNALAHVAGIMVAIVVVTGIFWDSGSQLNSARLFVGGLAFGYWFWRVDENKSGDGF